MTMLRLSMLSRLVALAAVTAGTAHADLLKVTCDKPGGWTISHRTVSLAPGVEETTVTLSSPTNAAPPRFKVSFAMPFADIPFAWSPSMSRLGGSFDTAVNYSMPLFTLLDANSGNKATLACSEVFRDVKFNAGHNFKSFEWRGGFEFFTVPEAPIRLYEVRVRVDTRARFWAGAVREAAAWMAEVSGNKPTHVPAAAFDPLYSSWYNFSQSVTADALEKELAIAAGYGMKTMILDDGWQTEKSGVGYANCGDWASSPVSSDTKQVDGQIQGVKDIYFQAMGIKYVVWLAPPLLGTKAKAYERFKDKILRIRWGDTCTLDPRFPEVRRYLVDLIGDRMEAWGVDGFKLDFIDWFSLKDIKDPALNDNYAGRDIKSMPAAVDALMCAIKERITAINPDALIEFRMRYVGPAMRKYGNMMRVGDCFGDYVCNRTCISSLRLTSGVTAVHSDMIEWPVSDSAESASRFILNSLFGVVQYSMILDKLPPDHARMVKHWIAFSQKHRDALLFGEFRPYHPEMQYPVIEGVGKTERVIVVHSDESVVDVPADRPAVVVNATNRPRLTLRFVRTPGSAKVFDAFGDPAGERSVSALLADVECPAQGYAEFSF